MHGSGAGAKGTGWSCENKKDSVEWTGRSTRDIIRYTKSQLTTVFAPLAKHIERKRKQMLLRIELSTEHKQLLEELKKKQSLRQEEAILDQLDELEKED